MKKKIRIENERKLTKGFPSYSVFNITFSSQIDTHLLKRIRKREIKEIESFTVEISM